MEGTQSDDGTQVQETFKSQYKCNKHNDSGSNRLNVWTSGVGQILLRFSARKTKSARWLISLNVGVYGSQCLECGGEGKLFKTDKELERVADLFSIKIA